MNEPDAAAVINAAAKRSRKTPEAAPAATVTEPVLPLSPVVANPFTDSTGNSLADDGQRVN